MTRVWSVDVPGLSMIRGQNQAGTGSVSVTVHGASMGLEGYTSQARNGKTGCEASEWESETSVRCAVTNRARGTRRGVLTAGEPGGSVTQVLSFALSRLSTTYWFNRAGTRALSLTVRRLERIHLFFRLVALNGL